MLLLIPPFYSLPLLQTRNVRCAASRGETKQVANDQKEADQSLRCRRPPPLQTHRSRLHLRSCVFRPVSCCRLSPGFSTLSSNSPDKWKLGGGLASWIGVRLPAPFYRLLSGYIRSSAPGTPSFIPPKASFQAINPPQSLSCKLGCVTGTGKGLTPEHPDSPQQR